MRLLRFSQGVMESDANDEIIEIPDIPADATPREIAGMLIQVVISLRNQFVRANKARDRQDRRRLWVISGTIAGLLIDVILSFVAFTLISSNHGFTEQLSRQQAAITRQQAEIHQSQLDSCRNSNMTRATAKGVWFDVLNQIAGPDAAPAARQFVSQAEAKIAKAYEPVDCSKVFGR